MEVISESDAVECPKCKLLSVDYYQCDVDLKTYCCDCINFCLVCDKFKSNDHFKNCSVCKGLLFINNLISRDKKITNQLNNRTYGFICSDCYINKEIVIIACQDENCSQVTNINF